MLAVTTAFAAGVVVGWTASQIVAVRVMRGVLVDMRRFLDATGSRPSDPLPPKPPQSSYDK